MKCPVYVKRDEPNQIRYTCGVPANTPCVDSHPFAGMTVCEWHSTFTEQTLEGFTIGFTCNGVT